MKTALACIAKNEDDYIDEWLKYNIAIGFDHIFVYQNDWRYNGNKNQWNDKVTWFEFDGLAKHKEQLNNFIMYHSHEFDWGACFDIDEFIVLKHSQTINDALSYYQDVPVLSVPWRVFGDSMLSDLPIQTYSVLKRFTRCRAYYDRLKKCIINFKKSGSNVRFIDPHYCTIPAIDPTRTFTNVKGSLFKGIENMDIDSPIELNHYAFKTKQEFVKRKITGGSAVYGPKKFMNKTEKDFEEEFDLQMQTANQVESLYAYNFAVKNKII